MDTSEFKSNMRNRIELASTRLIRAKIKLSRQLAIQTEIWTRFGAKIDAELESLKVLGGEVMAPGFIGSGEKRMIMTAMEDSD